MPTTGAWLNLGRQHTYPQQGADLASPVAADKQKQHRVCHVLNCSQSRLKTHYPPASISPHTKVRFTELEFLQEQQFVQLQGDRLP